MDIHNLTSRNAYHRCGRELPGPVYMDNNLAKPAPVPNHMARSCYVRSRGVRI